MTPSERNAKLAEVYALLLKADELANEVYADPCPDAAGLITRSRAAALYGRLSGTINDALGLAAEGQREAQRYL